MNNRQVWDAYDYYTSEISKNARTLGLAGIAICWFFRTPALTFPRPILWALVFVILFFIADLLQYYISAMRVRTWMRAEEERRLAETKSLEGEYDLPIGIHTPGHVLFHVKLATLLAGFLILGTVFAARL
jgi:hypothetical protein